MIIIYAPSYPTLIHALKIYCLNDIIVYSHNSSIIEFCANAKIKYKKIVHQKDYSFKGYVKHRKKVIELSRSIESTEIFFGFLSFDIWGLYFLFCLRNRNTINFVNKDPYYPETPFFTHFYSKGYRMILFKKMFLFIFTNIWFTIFKVSSNNLFLGIKEQTANKYFNNKKHQAVKSELYMENRRKILENFQIQPFKFMLIDTEPIDYKFDDETLNSIKNLFNSFDNQIVVKPHPTFFSSGTCFDKIKQIQKCIPVELLHNENVVVIGIYSSALKYFSDYQKTISLIELVEFVNEDVKKGIYSNFLSDSRILIPKNINELKQMLNN